jgi:hypothetical protein
MLTTSGRLFGMDRDTARWVASLFEQAIGALEQKPGVTIEVVDEPRIWAQVVPELAENAPKVAGFLLNFPYRGHVDDPQTVMTEHDILPPPDMRVVEWEENGYLRLWLRPDTPLVPMALFVGEVLEAVTTIEPEAEFAVKIEYGY